MHELYECALRPHGKSEMWMSRVVSGRTEQEAIDKYLHRVGRDALIMNTLSINVYKPAYPKTDVRLSLYT